VRDGKNWKRNIRQSPVPISKQGHIVIFLIRKDDRRSPVEKEIPG